MRYGRILSRSFYERPSEQVARDLVGKILCSGKGKRKVSGMIVETESYGGKKDPASHAYRKKTARNAVMFGPGGYAYVYFCYGMHFLFNAVTEKEGIPGAVLIRAVQPLEGLALMKKRRGTKKIRALASGPGRLARAFGITDRFNHSPLFKGELVIRSSVRRNFRIRRARRIGIVQGVEKLLRFYIRDNPFVSKK